MTGKKSHRGVFLFGRLGEHNRSTQRPNSEHHGHISQHHVAASEAKAAALFTNMNEGVIQHIALEEMQWPQPPTPITVDNSTAVGMAQDTIKANKSWAMDMCLHCIQDQAQQHQFLVTWATGKLNKADYFTKLHAHIHHHHMHFVYLHPPSQPTNPAHLSLANLSCGGVLNPGFHPWVGNPDVTGIPQVKLQHKSATVDQHASRGSLPHKNSNHNQTSSSH